MFYVIYCPKHSFLEKCRVVMNNFPCVDVSCIIRRKGTVQLLDQYLLSHEIFVKLKSHQIPKKLVLGNEMPLVLVLFLKVIISLSKS